MFVEYLFDLLKFFLIVILNFKWIKYIGLMMMIKKINNIKKNKELLIIKINDKKYFKKFRFFKFDLDF